MSQVFRNMRDEFEADYKVEPRNIEHRGDGLSTHYYALPKRATTPPQYDIGIDTFTRMRANATLVEAMGFIRWNIDKYNTRKKGQDKSDYKKIIDYCNEALWWLDNHEEQ